MRTWVVALALGGVGCDFVLGLERRPDATVPDALDGAGSMLVFDGLDDLVTFTRPVGDDFTIELWLRTTVISTGTYWPNGTGLVYGDGPTSAANDFGMSIGTGPVMFGVGNPDMTVYSNVGIADDRWHHVAATRSRATGELVLYVDGNLHMQLDHTNLERLDAVSKLVIGQANTFASPRHFKGELDELRIWSVVRTQDEIRADKDRVLLGTEAGLVTYYRFDDGDGLVATDSSPSGNAGSLGESVMDKAPMWMTSTAPLSAR